MHWTSAVTKSHTPVSAAAAAAAATVNDAQATTEATQQQRARVGVPVCAEVTTRAANDAR